MADELPGNNINYTAHNSQHGDTQLCTGDRGWDVPNDTYTPSSTGGYRQEVQSGRYRGGGGRSSGQNTCYKCGQPGHRSFECVQSGGQGQPYGDQGTGNCTNNHRDQYGGGRDRGSSWAHDKPNQYHGGRYGASRADTFPAPGADAEEYWDSAVPVRSSQSSETGEKRPLDRRGGYNSSSRGMGQGVEPNYNQGGPSGYSDDSSRSGGPNSYGPWPSDTRSAFSQGRGRGSRQGCFQYGDLGHVSAECSKPRQPHSGGWGQQGRDRSQYHGGGRFADDAAGGGGGFGNYRGPGHDINPRHSGGEQFDADDQPPPERVTYVPPDLTSDMDSLYRPVYTGINFHKYNNIPVEVTGLGLDESRHLLQSFDDPSLHEVVRMNALRCGYNVPLPVQRETVPIILCYRDVMTCAQTGSGKTAAFLMPTITLMLKEGTSDGKFTSGMATPTMLVLAPTRELVTQTYLEAVKFSHGSPLRCLQCYGGTAVHYNIAELRKGCDILIATPGRLLDLLNRNMIDLLKIRFLVLDEADRMLDMGFLPDVKRIIHDYGMTRTSDRQTLMFSATFPAEIQRLAKDLMHNYVFVTIGRVGGAADDICQELECIDGIALKKSRLLDLLNDYRGERVLVFTESKRMADFLGVYFSQHDLLSITMHGDRTQAQREEALSLFRKGTRPILIATAVAARGLDIEGILLVVNFDLPDNVDEYVHRIGRTGRVGNQGRAVSFFQRGRDEQLAPGLLKVLSDSDNMVPDWLQEMAAISADSFASSSGKFGSRDQRFRGGKSQSYSPGSSSHPHSYEPPQDVNW